MKNLLMLFVLFLSINTFAQKDGTYMHVEKVVFERASTKEVVTEDTDRPVDVKIDNNKIILTDAGVDDDGNTMDLKYNILEVVEDRDNFTKFLAQRGEKKYYVEFDFTEEIKAVFFRTLDGEILVGYMTGEIEE